MNRFIIAAFVAASCLVYRASAQEVNTNPVELPSATVWEFVKYNNAAANLYTGTVCIEIPVYTYEDSDFTIPVSLGYSSNGFKPNIQAPAAGHEWSLNAGGTVTRIVRGLPDEERNLSTFGFMETHNDSTLTGVGQLDGFTTGWDNDGIEAVSPTLFYAPYGWDNTSMLFDMEPDIFYFNFLGYSGKFQLGYDGAVHFYDTNTKDSEFALEIPRYDLNEITIVTGDGFRYTFGTGLAREFSGKTGTSWKLSEITAPNGRKVTFEYTRSARQYDSAATLTYQFFNNYAPSTMNYSFRGNYLIGPEKMAEIDIDAKPTRPKLSSPIFVSALDRIVFDNGSAIDFYYKTLPYNESGEGTILTILPKLDRIVVSNSDGEAVRTCALSYSFPPAEESNKIPFLSEIELSGEGVFSMEYDYDETTIFPKHGTFKIDHRGYYNNSSATYESFYAKTVQDEYLHESIGTSVRNPNGEYSRIGMLKSITYPTGGRTDFEYEPHDYSAYVTCEYPEFIPYLQNTVGRKAAPAGGMRIKSIKDYSSSDTTSPAYSREYSYLDSEGYSSGNLAPMPRYGLSYTRSTPPNENISVFLGSYNDLLPSDGTHIGYSRVVETLPEGSNEYRFISYRDCPDGKVTNMEYTNINNYLYDVTCNRNLSGTDARNAIMALMSPTISMESKRGKLLSKRSFDKNGDMVASQTTSYESYTYAYESLDKIWNLQSLYIGATRVATVIGDIRPVSVSTRISGVTETENYSYDSFRNLKTVVKDGKTSRFLYVQDLDDIEAFDDMVSASYWNSFRSTATARTMKRLNMVNLPLQEEIYDKNGILSIRRYNYGYRNASDTSLVVVKSIESYDQTSERWETVSHFDYDSLGNLVEATDPDGVSTVYIWGHGGLHLVAAVGNATIEQVEDASLLLPMFPGGPSRIVFPLSGIREAPVSGALSPLQEDALRSIPGAEVSSYAWRPLVGLLSATDPSGRTTSYERNASGKLRRVLDPLSRPTAAWLYSPDDRLSQ